MNSTLRDLIDHQLWADAQHWEAIEAHAPAAADTAILERLHHLHLAQRAFVWVVSDRSTALERSSPEASHRLRICARSPAAATSGSSAAVTASLTRA